MLLGRPLSHTAMALRMPAHRFEHSPQSDIQIELANQVRIPSVSSCRRVSEYFLSSLLGKPCVQSRCPESGKACNRQRTGPRTTLMHHGSSWHLMDVRHRETWCTWCTTSVQMIFVGPLSPLHELSLTDIAFDLLAKLWSSASVRSGNISPKEPVMWISAPTCLINLIVSFGKWDWAYNVWNLHRGSHQISLVLIQPMVAIKPYTSYACAHLA